MKVWVTRYCLSSGICQLEVGEPDRKGYVTVNSEESGFRNHYLKLNTECFEDKEVAIVQANRLKDSKIASLTRQIEKLRSVKFDG